MRRALIFLLLAVAAASPHAQTGASRPQQADGVVRLLADIENALIAGKLEAFRPLTIPALPVDAQLIFQGAVASGGVTSAAVREHGRRPLDNSEVEVLAEVFVSHGRNGRLATWVMTVRARGQDRYELVDLKEPASFDSLVRLALNETRQYTVHNLVLEAPDLTLKMASGSAFAAEDSGGITALVLRGNGAVTSSPKDDAERGQIAAFSGRPVLDTQVDTAYIRLDSAEFSSRIAEKALVPNASVDPRELSKARTLFDD